jgi:hypothetical protein
MESSIIRVWCKDDTSYAESGNVVLDDVVAGGQGYQTGSLAPAGRSFAIEGGSWLTRSAGRWEPSSTIALLEWPDIGRGRLRDPVLSPREIESLTKAILDEPQTVLRPQAFQVLGVHHDEAGQQTVTVDRDLGVRIGLHVDNWDHLPLARRKRSRNRLAVNLGPGDRELLIALVDIFASLRHAPGDRVPGTDDGRLIARRASAQICRMRLPSGFGYIAPTECLVHDGSTEYASEGSSIISFLGSFRPAWQQVRELQLQTRAVSVARDDDRMVDLHR